MSEDTPFIPEEQKQKETGNLEIIERPDIGLGDNYETNIPEEVHIFAEVDPEYSSSRPYEAINPGKLDELPGGEYYVRGEDPTKEENFIMGVSNKVDKKFKIVVFNDGKYLPESEQVGKLHPERGPESEPLLEKVGFVFSEEGTLIPTPITVQKKMHEVGVEVQLFDNTGLIPPVDFVRSFKDGKYPVATGEETYYAHDISDDHITGVLLGGELLRDTLSTALESKFSSDGKPLVSEQELGELAEGLDRFTQTLRAVVTPSMTSAGEQFGSEMGRKTLFKYGQMLGLDNETVNHILKAAQQKAQEFNLPLIELH